jgi:hypothetical protein
MVTRPNIWLAGAISGVLWWAISMVLGAKGYGVLGAHALVGVLPGACTGIAVAMLSQPVYRHLPARSLYWFSPLSVYLSVAIYGCLVFLVRSVIDDFHPDQKRLEVGLQSIIGMWWGVTFILPIAILVQLFAYANHRLLRRALTTR